MPAELVISHLFQDLIDQNAIDQDQLAHAPKSTHLMVTAVFHANQDMYQTTKELNATQLQPVMDQDRSRVPSKIAIDATNAQITWFQAQIEEDVKDQSQCADVTKDTQMMVMIALIAETDKLLTQITTRDVSHNNVTQETQSSQPEKIALDATNAHLVGNQTHRDQNASELSQNVDALRFMTQQDTTAFHAQHMKLPPIKIPDVSQDNAQD